jgi:hypothetical protein
MQQRTLPKKKYATVLEVPPWHHHQAPSENRGVIAKLAECFFWQLVNKMEPENLRPNNQFKRKLETTEKIDINLEMYREEALRSSRRVSDHGQGTTAWRSCLPDQYRAKGLMVTYIGWKSDD